MMAAPDTSTTSAPAKRSLWLRGVRVLVVVYIAWCAVIYFAQDSMVFPVTFAGEGGAVLVGAEVMELAIEDGGIVRAWYMPAPNASDDIPAPLVVFFHGNAELIDDQAHMALAYHDLGCSILLPEYRGYGHSDGDPSQAAIVADAVRFHDAVAQRAEVDTSRIIFHGRSIGEAVAAVRKPAALIMESTPASVAAMAWGFGVPPVFVKHPFRTDAIVRELDIPILLFHGSRDTIIPVTDSRRLHELAADSHLIEFDCDHNNLPGSQHRADYWDAIETHLASLTPEAN